MVGHFKFQYRCLRYQQVAPGSNPKDNIYAFYFFLYFLFHREHDEIK